MFFWTHLICPFLGKLIRQKYKKDKVGRKVEIQGESILTQKGKDIDSVQSKSEKKWGVMYPSSEN